MEYGSSRFTYVSERWIREVPSTIDGRRFRGGGWTVLICSFIDR